MSDDKLRDGIKLTVDAHADGQLTALRRTEALLEELMQRIRDQIAEIESRRDDDA